MAIALPPPGGAVARGVIDDHFARFDEYLDAVAALPDHFPETDTGRPDWRALPPGAMRVRSWGPARAHLAGAGPDDVISRRAAFVRLVRASAEIEQPWDRYTDESSAYLVLAGCPKLAGFMRYVWRDDERRHGPTLRAIYRAVTGADTPDNPHAVAPVRVGARALEHHLTVRLNAELGAAATYAVLAGHARGDLRTALSNLAGDELRHLAVFWAATSWRFGDGPKTRLLKWARHNLSSAAGHRRHRSGLGRIGLEDARLLAEVAGTLAQLCRRLLSWDKGLTPERLHEVFGPKLGRLAA